MKTENHKKIDVSIDQLKSVREAKNITVESLSDTLKVSKAFVGYIEDGHFEKLGAPTFIKGHVTNYCKALSLDPSVVIQQIPEHILQTQTIKPSDAYGASPLARVKQSSNHLGKYAVGTALLTMLALSFYFVWDKWSVPQGLDQETSALAVNDLKVEKDPTTKNKNITYSSLIPQVSLDNSSSVNPTNESEVVEPVLEDTAVDNQTNESVEDETQPPQIENSGDLNVTAVMAAYSIELQLDAQAWVSIKTEDGDSVVQDLVGPGVRQFQSNKPLHFRIGNAHSTRVLINDEPVDFTGYLKNDIADFTWPIDPS